LLHGLAKIHASFDDPNLVSRAGLVPVMALAQRAGLAALAGEHVAIAGRCGVNAHLKVPCLVAGPLAAPVIAATRLRGGNAGSARGAASFATESVSTARATGCAGTLVVRADSAFYSAAFTGAVRRAGAFFSVTVRMDPKVRAAIAAVPPTAWTPIRYPRAIFDDQLRCWVSEAEVAEAEYTAFTSKKGQAITARLIVRRVRDQNKKAETGQDELFPVWRCHAVFTDPPFEHPGRGAAPRPRRRGAGVRRRHQRAARPPAIRPFRRERRMAVHHGDGAQPGPRGRRPGQPPLRESPRRDHAPRPDRGHRPHRPARQGPHRPPPPRRLAPRTGMAEPLGRGLRPARRSGLTSPEPVRTPHGPTATPNPHPRARNQDKPHSRRAAGRPRPQSPRKTPRAGIKPETSYRNRPVDRGLS
jgi:hypothetical protein